MGYDSKYGNVTTEWGDIPDDEPVVVFRGRDRLLIAVLQHYGDLCEDEGSPDHHIDIITQVIERIADWQREHPDRVVTPTSNRYVESDWAHVRQ